VPGGRRVWIQPLPPTPPRRMCSIRMRASVNQPVPIRGTVLTGVRGRARATAQALARSSFRSRPRSPLPWPYPLIVHPARDRE
jgi:hypothetical protein